MAPSWLIAVCMLLLAAVVGVQVAYVRAMRTNDRGTKARVAVGIRVANIALVVVAAGLIIWALVR